jgi:hypothetical protein
MKMLLLDVYNNEVKVVEANGLEDYYKYIGCSVIDIVRRKIGDLTVEIVCDDEGTFVEHPKVSAIDIVGQPCLYGNLLVAGGKVIDGNLTELTEKEIKYLKHFIIEVATTFYKEPFKVFWEMDY